MQEEIQERDRYIENINKSANEVSVWAKSLEGELIKKNKEAVEISDWAIQLRDQLNSRNESLALRIRKRIGKLQVQILSLGVRSNLRHLCQLFFLQLKRLKKNKSLDAVKHSLMNCNGQLVIAFPIITWEFRWQRPQHMLSGLRDAGSSILYLAMTILPYGKRFKFASEALSYVGFSGLAENINQIWLRSYSSINVYSDSISGDDLHNLSFGLSSVINQLQPSSIIYMIHFPSWTPVALELKKQYGGKIIFDCMDDHAGFETSTADVMKVESDLITKADLVIASSELLFNKIRKQTDKVIQIKNGTDFKHFNESSRNGFLDHLSGNPIIGYYGAISSWFDADLIAYCAVHRPEWNFVLIGSTFGADLECLKDLSNVHLLGEVPYLELPGYLPYFDVCIIPFKLIPLTLATNPVKFYEYISAGKPVVSVNLPELVPYSDDCYLAEQPSDFLGQIEKALSEKNIELLIERRIKLAKENSWEYRVQQLLNHDLLK